MFLEKHPFTISASNFLIPYRHFLFFQLIPSSPWTPVAVPTHPRSVDPTPLPWSLTSPRVFTHTLTPCVHLQLYPLPLPAPSPDSELLTTKLKGIVWPANLEAFPPIRFLSPRPSSPPFSSLLQPPTPCPTPILSSWPDFLFQSGYKQPEEKFHMLWPPKLTT